MLRRTSWKRALYFLRRERRLSVRAQRSRRTWAFVDGEKWGHPRGTVRVLEADANLKPRGTLLWMHGMGDSTEGFAELWRIEIPSDIRVVLPEAPIRPITVNGGAKMQSWYDIRVLGDKSDAYEDYKGINEVGHFLKDVRRKNSMDQSAKVLTKVLEREEDVVGVSSKIVVGGFSQGAAMGLRVGLLYPRKLAGIICTSGYLVSRARYSANMSSNRNTPVWMWHGRMDQMVGEEWGRKTKVFLENLGVPVEYHTHLWQQHYLVPEEIDGIVDFVEERLEKLE